MNDSDLFEQWYGLHAFDYSADPIEPRERALQRQAFLAGLAHARGEAVANVAKIDQLMLEFCPERMTPAQIAEWGANQSRVSPEREDAFGVLR